MKRLLVALLAIASVVVFLTGCGSEQKDAPKKADSVVTVGVTAGPHEQVMDFVAKEAEKQGIKIKVVSFSDYVQPNMALANKEIDMNSYQHVPYLQAMDESRGLKLAPIGKTILLPMGIYSTKSKSLGDIPNGASVAIPNDPTNGGRALLVLAQAGLIKLKDGVGVKATKEDIVSNPHNLKIEELDAAQIARSLSDVGLACINTNYALNAGLNPLKDALYVESKDSPYVNVIAVREADKNNETYQKIVKIYESEPVKKYIEETFKSSIVPAF